jgi:hypothetical protein
MPNRRKATGLFNIVVIEKVAHHKIDCKADCTKCKVRTQPNIRNMSINQAIAVRHNQRQFRVNGIEAAKKAIIPLESKDAHVGFGIDIKQTTVAIAKPADVRCVGVVDRIRVGVRERKQQQTLVESQRSGNFVAQDVG